MWLVSSCIVGGTGCVPKGAECNFGWRLPQVLLPYLLLQFL